jgi:RNA polymerase sigma factor FliA
MNIEKYYGLVKKIAKGKYFKNTILDYSDLVQYGVIGLIDAYKRYDSSTGVQFQTYATIRIRGAIVDGMRTIFKRCNNGYLVISHDELLGDGGDYEYNHLSAVEREPTEIMPAINKLTEQERKVIMMRYHQGYSQKEIGERLGISQSRVCQIHRKALRELKNNLEVG